MRILTKDELYLYKKDKVENIHQLLPSWLKDELISTPQNNAITQTMTRLNYEHHNTFGFEDNFINLFTNEKINTIDRSGIGSSFAGFQLKNNLHFFTETSEYGINIYAIKEEINSQTIKEYIETVYFLVEALKDVDLAKRLIASTSLNNKLENILDNKEATTIKIKM